MEVLHHLLLHLGHRLYIFSGDSMKVSYCENWVMNTLGWVQRDYDLNKLISSCNTIDPNVLNTDSSFLNVSAECTEIYKHPECECGCVLPIPKTEFTQKNFLTLGRKEKNKLIHWYAKTKNNKILKELKKILTEIIFICSHDLFWKYLFIFQHISTNLNLRDYWH